MTDDEVLALYERTVDGVYRYATRLTGGDRSWADELVQETYLHLLRRMRTGETLDIDAGWLVVSCRHRFLDQLKRDERRRARELRSAEPIDHLTPGPPDEPVALGALDRLAGDHRAVLVMRYVDDLAIARIADEMGRSLHATESLLARARAALRTELTKEAGR